MFYEIYDWDPSTCEKTHSLVNLDNVCNINFTAKSIYHCDGMNWYYLTLSFNGKDNEIDFYYESEAERLAVYNNIKNLLKQKGELIGNKLSATSSEFPKEVSEDFKELLESIFPEEVAAAKAKASSTATRLDGTLSDDKPMTDSLPKTEPKQKNELDEYIEQLFRGS